MLLVISYWDSCHLACFSSHSFLSFSLCSIILSYFFSASYKQVHILILSFITTVVIGRGVRCIIFPVCLGGSTSWADALCGVSCRAREEATQALDRPESMPRERKGQCAQTCWASQPGHQAAACRGCGEDTVGGGSACRGWSSPTCSFGVLSFVRDN